MASKTQQKYKKTRAVAKCLPEFSFAPKPFDTTQVLNMKGSAKGGLQKKGLSLLRSLSPTVPEQEVQIEGLYERSYTSSNLQFMKTEILLIVFLSFWCKQKTEKNNLSYFFLPIK